MSLPPWLAPRTGPIPTRKYAPRYSTRYPQPDLLVSMPWWRGSLPWWLLRPTGLWPRTALLDALLTTDGWDPDDVVSGVLALVTTEADQAGARTAVLDALSAADPWDLGDLMAGLFDLEPTEAERAEARMALLTALPTADPFDVGELVAALRSVSSVESWLAWLGSKG